MFRPIRTHPICFWSIKITHNLTSLFLFNSIFRIQKSSFFFSYKNLGKSQSFLSEYDAHVKALLFFISNFFEVQILKKKHKKTFICEKLPSTDLRILHLQTKNISPLPVFFSAPGFFPPKIVHRKK